jgi:hypothetical protein
MFTLYRILDKYLCVVKDIGQIFFACYGILKEYLYVA